MPVPFEIRELSSDPQTAQRELQACVAAQRAVGWGEESVPTHVLRADAMQQVVSGIDLGFVLLAVKEDGTVVGFCRVTYTRQAGQMYLHEIVVVPEMQSSGLGFALMDQLRVHCIQRGAHELMFTFDPMNLSNLFFYIRKCGCTAVHLLTNFYDVHPTPPPSCSVLAKWDLEHRSALKGSARELVFPVKPSFEDDLICYRLPAFPARLSKAEQALWINLLEQLLNEQKYELIGLPSSDGKAFLFAKTPLEQA